jgi:DNA-binding FrmR family transcriptional regulator
MKEKSVAKKMPGKTQRGADHGSELARINRITGQIEGIRRMIEERAYCPDIITQIQAARSALGSLQASILSGHLQHCVENGIKQGDARKLLDELTDIFKRG